MEKGWGGRLARQAGWHGLGPPAAADGTRPWIARRGLDNGETCVGRSGVKVPKFAPVAPYPRAVQRASRRSARHLLYVVCVLYVLCAPPATPTKKGPTVWRARRPQAAMLPETRRRPRCSGLLRERKWAKRPDSLQSCETPLVLCLQQTHYLGGVSRQAPVHSVRAQLLYRA